MQYKSTQTKFGLTAVMIHWISAFVIFLMFAMGFAATNFADPAFKISLLQGHVIFGIIALLLTIFRIVWWVFLDKKPDDLTNIPNWQNRISHWVHRLFYVFIIVMSVSGIGMMILSGAGEILFGNSTNLLPEFEKFPPRLLHGIIAKLFIALIAIHIGAALYHHFILRDGLLKRIKLK